MGELKTFHVSVAMQCSIYYHIYLIKRRPRSRAAYASKINNKSPPLEETPHLIRRIRRLVDDNKENLGATRYFTPLRHLRFYLSKMRDTWEPLNYIILTNNLQ